MNMLSMSLDPWFKNLYCFSYTRYRVSFRQPSSTSTLCTLRSDDDWLVFTTTFISTPKGTNWSEKGGKQGRKRSERLGGAKEDRNDHPLVVLAGCLKHGLSDACLLIKNLHRTSVKGHIKGVLETHDHQRVLGVHVWTAKRVSEQASKQTANQKPR